jgi:hypothetical protein
MNNFNLIKQLIGLKPVFIVKIRKIKDEEGLKEMIIYPEEQNNRRSICLIRIELQTSGINIQRASHGVVYCNKAIDSPFTLV